MRGGILAALLGAPAAPRPAAAEPPSFLPAVFARFEAARYFPSEDAQVWTGWIGAGADLLEAGKVTFEFTADVETIIGREIRTFDPTQANYHLSGAMRIVVAGDELIPFFHHVSRHEVDRPKVQAVDWNLMGVRGRVAFAGGRGHAAVGVGRVLGDSPVGYTWEFTGRLEFEPVRRLYTMGDVRHVVAEAVPEFPRGSFTDWSLEGGIRWGTGPRILDLFAAFERRNDVFVQAPGVRDRLLLGFRLAPRDRIP
jgi:hypothetical protein